MSSPRGFAATLVERTSATPRPDRVDGAWCSELRRRAHTIGLRGASGSPNQTAVEGAALLVLWHAHEQFPSCVRARSSPRAVRHGRGRRVPDWCLRFHASGFAGGRGHPGGGCGSYFCGGAGIRAEGRGPAPGRWAGCFWGPGIARRGARRIGPGHCRRVASAGRGRLGCSFCRSRTTLARACFRGRRRLSSSRSPPEGDAGRSGASCVTEWSRGRRPADIQRGHE